MARRHQLLAIGLALGLAGCGGPHAKAQQQPIPWSYTFDPTGVPIASYPGTLKLPYGSPASGACLVFGTGGQLAAGPCGAAGGPSFTAPGTWTATQTFQGGPGTLGLVADSIGEVVAVNGSAPPATVNFDTLSQSVVYYTSSATGNWTVNFRGNSGSPLGAVLAVGQSITITLISTQGATAYYNSAVQIDGSAVTPKWAGGAPSAGNASGLDVYAYSIVKTGASSYTVLASLTQFK